MSKLIAGHKRFCDVTITLVYRIFGDLKFITDLWVSGGAESENCICFCPSGQD